MPKGPGPRNPDEYQRTPRFLPYWERYLGDPRFQTELFEKIIQNPGFPAVVFGAVVLILLWEYSDTIWSKLLAFGGLFSPIASVATAAAETGKEILAGDLMKKDEVQKYLETGDDSHFQHTSLL